MERFILQTSERDGHYVCTDQENGIVCVFEAHNFNDNQTFTILQDSAATVNEMAISAREMGDWLRENHYDKIF